jgi:hypothetical protein
LRWLDDDDNRVRAESRARELYIVRSINHPTVKREKLETARWIKDALARLRYHDASRKDFKDLLGREERMLFREDRKRLVAALKHARIVGKNVFAGRVTSVP